MTREEQRMKLWCDIYAQTRQQRYSDADAKTCADLSLDSLDDTFPPPEPDTRFDRLVQWIRNNSRRDGGELIINAHEFERAVKEI